MRVAAVALVLVVGAAVVLAFANTLNSWVLGGLLGGLAAILLSIPISLALFTLLARRHDARQRSRDVFFEEEPELAEDAYGEGVVYEAEGYLSLDDEDSSMDSRARYLLNEHRLPASGYLRLPPAGYGQDSYEDDTEQVTRREPRNYPRQPRSTSRSLARDTGVQVPQNSQRSTQGETRRHPSTHALAQHQSEALRLARQEAQQHRSKSRADSDSLARRPQESRSQYLQRLRSERQPRTRPTTPGFQRSLDERATWSSRQREARLSWNEEEEFSDELSTDQHAERYQHYPRRPSYPRQPRSGRTRDDELNEAPGRRARGASEKMSGSLHNPLVRRAPYLYDDDPLSEEFAQQLDYNRPLTRRASLYQRYEEDEEF